LIHNIFILRDEKVFINDNTGSTKES